MNKRINFIFLLLLLFSILIRVYKVNSIPPALHGDELGVGYNAYSLFKTGMDEYGISFPFTFRNDFSPFIHYITIPFVALLGLNELSTRLPIVVVGILSIPGIYFLTKSLFNNRKLALLSATCPQIPFPKGITV